MWFQPWQNNVRKASQKEYNYGTYQLHKNSWSNMLALILMAPRTARMNALVLLYEWCTYIDILLEKEKLPHSTTYSKYVVVLTSVISVISNSLDVQRMFPRDIKCIMEECGVYIRVTLSWRFIQHLQYSGLYVRYYNSLGGIKRRHLCDEKSCNKSINPRRACAEGLL